MQSNARTMLVWVDRGVVTRRTARTIALKRSRHLQEMLRVTIVAEHWQQRNPTTTAHLADSLRAPSTEQSRYLGPAPHVGLHHGLCRIDTRVYMRMPAGKHTCILTDTQTNRPTNRHAHSHAYTGLHTCIHTRVNLFPNLITCAECTQRIEVAQFIH
jgi:hypothetical protein